jgi:cobalt/nickel transport system permease protein
MTGTTPLGHVELGFWRLTATREGLLAGALIASRVLGSLGIVILCCHGAAIHEVLAALRWARVPRTCLEIAMLMVRYVHILFEQAGSELAVQKVRLGYNGMRRSFRSTGSLAGIVMLRALDQAEKSHEAMLARGYQGVLPLPSLPALSRRQVALAGAGVTLVAMAYVLAERFL